jgi:hypothetical protein
MHTDADASDRSLAPLLSHLVVAAASALAGVVLGGWLAFETGYWRGFKSLIEGVSGGALVVGLALVAIAVGVTLAASARAANS